MSSFLIQTSIFGEINEVLNVFKPTESQHLTELKEVGIIKGTIEAPKVRYCINNDNRENAKRRFGEFSLKNMFEKNNCC